ncbi:MAG: glycosyl-4,4'-diaponeurosporenoate acyltransferase [Eubacteriales bacterium]|nr:glycosyl-4,4'-diaponeurosporenoate acyltransferase [Eubacteriales bacterium]
MDFLRCALYLSALGVLSFLFGRLLPKGWINGERFPFRTGAAEDRVYCFLRVRVWQNRLPDMSRVFPSLMPPKNLSGSYRARLPLMIRETCVAELTHVLLMVLGFGCLSIWHGIGGWILSVLFCLGNLPFVMIQRYNRPRLIRLAKWIAAREQSEPEKEPEKADVPDREVQKCES